jgi:transcriptional regulator with XRE-family HTH domain
MASSRRSAGKSAAKSEESVDQSSEADRRLGARIRSLRQAQSITLKDAATQAGVSESFLSQVERGLANPSIASLRRIAQALDQPVATLFVGGDEHGGLVRLHERRWMSHPSGFVDSMVTPPTARQLQIHHTVIEPGGSSGRGLYTHTADEECVLVLQGSLLVTVDESTVRLDEGDSLLLDPRHGHAFRNPLETPTTVLWVMTPGNGY